MAKDKITEYDSVASNNLDVGGISVAEGMLPSGVNNAIRELMSHQKEAFGAGTPLYVDQTNNRVGVNNAAPATALDVTGGLNTTGNVGIGTSPSQLLHLSSSSPRIRIDHTSGGISYIDAATNGVLEFVADDTNVVANSSMRFKVDGSEAMRISGGNLLVGKTVQSIGTVGVTVVSGQVTATADGADAIRLNRKTSDGSIIDFRKDGTTVGSIDITSDAFSLKAAGGKYVTINSQSSGYLEFLNSSYTASPRMRPDTDNAFDLGDSGRRFDDIYATNGTIQTSDQNEKQQIAALTDAEMTAAKTISALFKTFKWNNAVAEKGDAARTHAGVIAQDVQAAMTAAGLDAGDYAFFISSTWWETQTEVPAVEAVDAVLDEDGNVVTEAVEAVAAYTRTDTYDTAEEAPEGATERTRMGIRYPELLSFIGAATEQRLSNIETRLAALEA